MYAKYKKNQDGISELQRPLDLIHDRTHLTGRFPKAPLPQLSSLADAPILSSSRKSTVGKRGNVVADKLLDSGRFENRRGTQLAPVKLNALKMPPSPSGKKPSGMSFMPKGSSLNRNIRKTQNENFAPGSHSIETKNSIMEQEDYNESSSSDGSSKYSYEESDDDIEEEYYDKNLHDSMTSPVHPAYESPDAVDINSLVQLNLKMPSGRETSGKNSPLLSLNDRGPPSLSLRKMGQPTSLKPLQPAVKKKVSSKKRSKNLKSLKMSKNDSEENEIAVGIEEERWSMVESIQKEWAAMQEEFKKEEKVKYEKMVEESSKKLEEEQYFIKKQHSDQISKLKSDLNKLLKEEQSVGENNLVELKKSNELLYQKEDEAFRQKLHNLVEEKNSEINQLKEENAKKINEVKSKLKEEKDTEVENLKSMQKDELEKLKESHLIELSLVEKSHADKMNEINLLQTKELNNSSDEIIERKVSNTENIQLEIEKAQNLLEKKCNEHLKLSEELKQLEDKIKTKSASLSMLEEKITTSQTYFEEIQDEVDKTENDLDLLRTEKSALISELSILKENINGGKNILKNFEKKEDSLNSKTLPLNYEHKSVNTEIIVATLCQSIQTYTEIKDAACQIVEEKVPKTDVSSQTVETKLKIFDKSCQIDLMEDVNMNNKSNSFSRPSVSDINEVTDIGMIVNKSLENALSSMKSKIDERFKVIEKHIGSLSQNVNHTESVVISPEAVGNSFSTANNNIDALIVPNILNPNMSLHNTIENNTLYQHSLVPNQKSCGCVSGDPKSCDVMQDVKNSIYRLNDILGQTFMPALNNTTHFYQGNSSMSSYISPLDSFYSQFRQLQEKHRITYLKHQCQNEVKKQMKNPMALTGGSNQIKDLFKAKDYLKPNNIAPTNLNTIDFSEDALARARNLVMKEKLKAWKESQHKNSPASSSSNQHFSGPDNFSYSISSRTSPALNEPPYLNFESDPESDYNTWKMRLNTLQQRIRNHKLL